MLWNTLPDGCRTFNCHPVSELRQVSEKSESDEVMTIRLKRIAHVAVTAWLVDRVLRQLAEPGSVALGGDLVDDGRVGRHGWLRHSQCGRDGNRLSL